LLIDSEQKPAVAPTKRSSQGELRRDQILVAAERVFAQQGYHGTTMRNVAQEAGVKLALLQYHFNTKIGLFTAIFERRQYVNEERLALLHAIPDLSAPSALEEIVDALIGPPLRLHHSPDDVWFARLILRETADPSNLERPVMRRFFDPLAREFISALLACLPDKPAGFHLWAYLFSIGALTQSVDDGRALAIDPEASEASQAFLRRYIVSALRYS
jgi:AcrR family transcriptional regulator